MKKLALLLSLLLMFTFSCKKTVDSEKKTWDYNLKKITKLAYEYPSFKKVLMDQQKKAEKVMNDSASNKDEKAKIKQMAQANSMLRTTFIRNLGNITSLKESINKRSIKIRGMSMPYDKKMGANQAVYASERAVNDVNTKLNNSVTNTNEAEALSSIAISNLKSADSNLKSIISEVESQKNAEMKKNKEVKDANVKAEKEKIEAAKPIKCQYCGTFNPANSTTCKNCGAPIKKK